MGNLWITQTGKIDKHVSIVGLVWLDMQRPRCYNLGVLKGSSPLIEIPSNWEVVLVYP